MIARELAHWGTGHVEVPGLVREAALRHLLDGLGTALAAARLGAAAPVVAVARGLAGPAEATLLGTRDRLSAPAAALANGTLVHALDFDDTHAGGLVHATSVVLPAALAVGQQLHASGSETLTAAVVGYETVCRIAACAPNGFHARGLHATMVAGVFSSALVAARLMGLDADRATQALGIAGSQAGGLLAFLSTGSSTKQLHPGFASQAGILAARLAAAGATGPETVFDGPHGVFDALATGAVDPTVITDRLGERWETLAIGMKPYPACQLSHASMAAAAEAMRANGLQARDVVAIHARVHPDSATVVCDPLRDLSAPATPYGAKFSLPWSVAAIVVDGSVGLDTFTPVSLARPEVRALASRVTWDLIATATTVAADAPGDVVLTLHDGTTVTGHVDRSPGGGVNPMAPEDVRAKFAENVFAGTEDQSSGELLRVMEQLDAEPDLERLIDLASDAVANHPDPEAAAR